MVLIHGKHTAPAEAPGAETEELEGEAPQGVSRRKLLIGGGAGALLIATGLWASNRVGKSPSGDSGRQEPGLAGGQGQAEGGQDNPDLLKVRAMGDAIQRSPESQQAIAKLLGVNAASLRIETPPPQPWPGVTFAQVTSLEGQGSVKVFLPQRGTLKYSEMWEVLKHPAPGDVAKRFHLDNDQIVGEITAPQHGEPGMLGWKAPNTPQESVFGMDVNSQALAGMTQDQKILEVWAATQTLLAAGVFERPQG